MKFYYHLNLNSYLLIKAWRNLTKIKFKIEIKIIKTKKEIYVKE